MEALPVRLLQDASQGAWRGVYLACTAAFAALSTWQRPAVEWPSSRLALPLVCALAARDVSNASWLSMICTDNCHESTCLAPLQSLILVPPSL